MLERTFSRSGDNDAMVTNCDRLAAHPADGLKLAPGIPMQQMNVPAARTECLRALSRAPHSARLQYQLSRAYLIANDYAPGLTYLRTAAAAGYPQAQFALAQMLLRGDGVPADACAGGRTMLAAARQRHLYARLYFGTYWLKNDFATCALDTSDAEVLHLIEDADALAATPAEHAEVATVQQAWHRQRG
jgi:TPR repeat protein